jgi:hypothetical protein
MDTYVPWRLRIRHRNNIYGFKTDYFLSIFKEVNTIQKYKNDCDSLKCQNLEDYMYKKLCKKKL